MGGKGEVLGPGASSSGVVSSSLPSLAGNASAAFAASAASSPNATS